MEEKLNLCLETSSNPISPEARDSGFALRLRVSPGAAKARVIGIHDGALKIAVREPPERGKANRGVLKLLAKVLDLPPGNLALVAGNASRDKRIMIRGVTEKELTRRIGNAIADRSRV